MLFNILVNMFDLVRTKNAVADHYFRILQSYKKPQLLKAFIQQWFHLITSYSQEPHFLSFDPPVPVIQRLIPHAVGVLVVPFPNTRVPVYLKRVSIFPLYSFRINYKHHTECCREGVEILLRYLEMTDIQMVGFYKVPHAPKVIDELQEKYPNLKCYGPSAFGSFKTVCSTIRKQ